MGLQQEQASRDQQRGDEVERLKVIIIVAIDQREKSALKSPSPRDSYSCRRGRNVGHTRIHDTLSRWLTVYMYLGGLL